MLEWDDLVWIHSLIHTTYTHAVLTLEYHTLSAIEHPHSQRPPIIDRTTHFTHTRLLTNKTAPQLFKTSILSKHNIVPSSPSYKSREERMGRASASASANCTVLHCTVLHVGSCVSRLPARLFSQLRIINPLLSVGINNPDGDSNNIKTSGCSVHRGKRGYLHTY